jgi:hypothetical protein
MEPTRIELLEAWITIQKLLQTDPKLDEYHKQISARCSEPSEPPSRQVKGALSDEKQLP